MSAPTPRLSRGLTGHPAARPVRMVHIGLGNFHRAHQAWYTEHAADGGEWGIAAFTGRSPNAAEELAPQDGLYTLITRSADGDELAVIGSVSEAHPAAEHATYLDLLSRPEVVVVTITVTEAGYVSDEDGHLRTDDEAVRADLAALENDLRAPVSTLPARLVAGLAARRAAGAGPITVLSCDNLPSNGTVTATVADDVARQLSTDLADWIVDHVDFASSMVDRITPATTDDDRTLVLERNGVLDAAPVPTEPFSEWVVQGTFPAGRPQWETAGVQLVDDVAPYEQRKLTLLNGAHTLLACAASARGHTSVDEAVADPTCRAWVEEFWDEAEPHLALSGAAVADYRTALLARFGNPRVRHLLGQIVADSFQKLGVRILPTVRSERAAGRLPAGAATALAGWVLHLQGVGAPVKDAHSGPARAAAATADGAAAVPAVLATLAADLAADQEFCDLVADRLTMIIGGDHG